MSDDIITTLENACIASCNCDTKTPDSEYHAPLCRYRALDEAIRHITEQRVTIANNARMHANDSLRLAAKGMHVRRLEDQAASYRASAEAEIAQLRQQLAAVTASTDKLMQDNAEYAKRHLASVDTAMSIASGCAPIDAARGAK